MAENLKAGELPLSRIFSSEYNFFIPSYQRPYSWSVNEAGTLFDDLYDFWKIQPNDQAYFLGSIVLVKKDNEPSSEVIDGQQRLTPLTILLAALSKAFDDVPEAKNTLKNSLWEQGNIFLGIEAKPRLRLRERDADFFDKYILSEDFDSLCSLNPKVLSDSQRMLQSNTALMRKNLAAKLADTKEAVGFASFLLKNCYLVVVTTPNKMSAFRVFSVLNNRGMSLLPSDIIKASVIGRIDEDKQQKYTDKWDDVEDTLGRDGFNALFSHIRMVYAKNKSQRTMVEEFENHVSSQFPDAKSLIDNVIEPYASAYHIAVHAAYESANMAAAVNSNLRWLNKIDDADWIPPTIVALNKYDNDEQFLLQFTTMMERLAAAMYLTSKTLNYRIDRHSNILKALEIGTQADVIRAMQLTPEEKNLLMNTLNGDIYHLPARKRSYAITRLDSFVSDNAYSQLDTTVLTVEHVLPQNPSYGSDWLTTWPDTEQRTRWVHRIANLIPLTRKKNSQAQNYDFETKKQKYFTGKYGTTSYALATQILNCLTWTPDDVIDRQTNLLRVFSDNWDLDYYVATHEDESVADIDVASIDTTNTIDHKAVRLSAAKRIGAAYRVCLTHQKNARFVDGTFAVQICSAEYHAKNNEFWYSVSPEVIDWLEGYKSAYVAFAMGTSDNLLLFNLDEIKALLPSCLCSRSSTTAKIRQYHIAFTSNGTAVFFKQKKPKREFVNVTNSLLEDNQ